MPLALIGPCHPRCKLLLDVLLELWDGAAQQIHCAVGFGCAFQSFQDSHSEQNAEPEVLVSGVPLTVIGSLVFTVTL